MNEPVWDDGRWDPLPPVEEDLDADVCVVGLGGSGLACVHALLDQGMSVVGVDAGPVAGGAAGRNGGFLLAGLAAFHHDAVAAHGRERAVALYRATLDEIGRMTAETPEHVRLTGSIRIALSPAEREDCDRQRTAMLADGLPVESYEGPEGGGLLFPRDGTFQPLARCRSLARRAVGRGARLFERSPALVTGGGGVVVGPHTIRASRGLVIAVDGGLPQLLPSAAAHVRTARLQMLATAPTDEIRLPRPVYARYGYEYWQQLPDRRLVMGGFRDRAGDAEWTEDSLPSELVQRELESFLRSHLGVRAPVTHRWAASVGYTASGLPHVAHPHERVWALGGYSGTGNVVGAMLGRAVAEWIGTGRVPPLLRWIEPSIA